MPWSYSELFWARASSLDMSWQGMNKPWCSAVNCFLLEAPSSYAHVFGPAWPREAGTKAGPVASKARSGPQIQTLCQMEGKRTSDDHRENRKTKTRWVKGLVQHHMAGWWRTGTQLVFLPCPALWLVSVYLDPYPRGKATTPALHEHGSGTKGIWGLSCLLFFFTQLNGFFIGEQWLQWCSAHFYFPEHLTVPCI